MYYKNSLHLFSSYFSSFHPNVAELKEEHFRFLHFARDLYVQAYVLAPFLQNYPIIVLFSCTERFSFNSIKRFIINQGFKGILGTRIKNQIPEKGP